MTAPPSDALKNLVIFILVLAIAATIVTLAWYFLVELPAQQALLQAPVWNLCPNDCKCPLDWCATGIGTGG